MTGTHNSMSYLKPQWYLRPFAWIARCQSKTIEQQIKDGVRLFDMRIRFDDNHEPYFAHGLMAYKNIDVIDVLHKIPSNSYVRIILETNKYDYTQELLFKLLCQKIYYNSISIVFFEGRSKYNWEQLYDFKHNFSLTQYVGSMQSWYGKVCPYLYAKRNNKKNLKGLNNDMFALFDFL